MNCRKRAALSLAASIWLVIPAYLRAQPTAPDTTLRVLFGAYVDAYFAYDFGRPLNFDRSFTTQPARHDEFNVNLAFIETTLTSLRMHGRFAAQYGTSVQSNYLAEPRNGVISGPSVSQFIQEAYAGWHISEGLWVDGGIFFANMGMEGWISRDNPTYTRSLVADFSPYYSSGARLIWQSTSRLTTRFDVINGWQNISETNTDKAVALRFDYAITPAVGLSYYNFFGNELDSRLRTFNGVGVKGTLAGIQFLGEWDYGTQQRIFAGNAHWSGWAAIARVPITASVAIPFRVEAYNDREGVILNTGLTGPGGVYLPFVANGVSVGMDVSPQPKLQWRTEVRGFFGEEPVFPRRGAPNNLGKSSGFVVTGLTLTF
jgi:Putative beta-barrel porin-2, OmpL-like. bbp2